MGYAELMLTRRAGYRGWRITALSGKVRRGDGEYSIGVGRNLQILGPRLTPMKLLRILFALSFVASLANAREPIEDQKIDFLIRAVAQMQDAVFVRNGNEYSAQQAADHMRLKLRHAGDRVKTVDDFIIYCAASSSVSGQPYTIKFHDGRAVPSADFLRAKLAEFVPPSK